MDFTSDLTFNDKIYSIKNNKIVTWNIEAICFCNYNMDKWGNKCVIHPCTSSKPDVEYRVYRTDEETKQKLIKIVDYYNLGKEFFKTKEDLFKSMEE